jgi:hypothetical protein
MDNFIIGVISGALILMICLLFLLIGYSAREDTIVYDCGNYGEFKINNVKYRCSVK